MSPRPSPDDFESQAAQAVREVEVGPGGVQDIRLTVKGPPLRGRARFLVCDGLRFTLGENTSDADVMLRGAHAGPLIAIHVMLRGSARLALEGLDTPIGGTIGQLALYATPTGRSTVELQRRTLNRGFRIMFSRAKLDELAARYSIVEPLAASVAAGVPFLRRHTRSVDVTSWVDDAMTSEHLGPARPMFLEARATEWLAALLGTAGEPTPRLSRRELARMHEARDILIAATTRPPTLAELAARTGTNEFALKRNFKLAFGRPPYAFVLAHRLQRASQLLIDTEQSIKEIAAAIGYAHANHFSTAFRRQFGLTPWQHRAAARRPRS